MRVQVAVSDSSRVDPEDEQGGEQRVGGGIAETQVGDRLGADGDRGGEGGECLGAPVRGIVAEGLDVPHTSVGGEAVFSSSHGPRPT